MSRFLPLASDQANRPYIPDSEKQDQYSTGHRTACRHSPHRPACGPRSPPRAHRPLPLVSSSLATTTPRIRSSDPTRGFSKMTETGREVALEARARNQSDRGMKSWSTIKNGHYGSVSSKCRLVSSAWTALIARPSSFQGPEFFICEPHCRTSSTRTRRGRCSPRRSTAITSA